MTDHVETFASALHDNARVFAAELARTRAAEPEVFQRLAVPMLQWAETALGPNWPDVLVDGYCEFVMDVNRAQLSYEKTGRYESSNFQEVYERAYSRPEFMQLYHWGVYTTTFVWHHHLRIYKFFEEFFLPLLAKKPAGTLVDLGAGSGIWHLLALRQLKNWNVKAVDISAPSVERSRKMAETLNQASLIEHIVADATTWAPAMPADAGISCFLLEHLEKPQAILAGLSASLAPGAPAFITAALTAAEVDHIYEFRRESEIVQMCESNGFRVKAMFSAEPEATPQDRYYLPRSIALVLQKKHNAIW
jgi:2-polyprenyl-3-methyl-5-hydroxy-6-metoxy-1,4-benzoquinol methylase